MIRMVCGDELNRRVAPLMHVGVEERFCPLCRAAGVETCFGLVRGRKGPKRCRHGEYSQKDPAAAEIKGRNQVPPLHDDARHNGNVPERTFERTKLSKGGS